MGCSSASPGKTRHAARCPCPINPVPRQTCSGLTLISGCARLVSGRAAQRLRSALSDGGVPGAGAATGQVQWGVAMPRDGQRLVLRVLPRKALEQAVNFQLQRLRGREWRNVGGGWMVHGVTATSAASLGSAGSDCSDAVHRNVAAHPSSWPVPGFLHTGCARSGLRWPLVQCNTVPFVQMSRKRRCVAAQTLAPDNAPARVNPDGGGAGSRHLYQTDRQWHVSTPSPVFRPGPPRAALALFRRR